MDSCWVGNNRKSFGVRTVIIEKGDFKMSEKIIELNNNNFQGEVIDEVGVVLVDFYAEWCAPCKLLSQTVIQLNEEFDGIVKICKANVESNSEAVSDLTIKNVPAIVLYKDGEVVKKHIGLRSKKDIKSDLNIAISA